MAISGGGGGHVTRVSEAVEFPELSEFTLCFEVERTGHKQVRPESPPAGRKQEAAEAPSVPAGGSVETRLTVPPLPHQEEWLFSYSHSSSQVALGLVSQGGVLRLLVGGASCPLDQSRLSSSSFTSSMTPLCLQWSSADGLLGVLLQGQHWTQTCPASAGRLLPPGGRFQLGGQCRCSWGSAPCWSSWLH